MPTEITTLAINTLEMPVGWDELQATDPAAHTLLDVRTRDEFAAFTLSNLDINATPTLEVTVDEVTGPWGVVIKMGSLKERDMEGIRVAGPLTKTGTVTFDLRTGGAFDPPSGHAELRLCTLT